MDYYFENLLNTYEKIWYDLKPIEPSQLHNHCLDQKKNDNDLIKFKKTFLDFINRSENLKDLNTPKNQDYIRSHVQNFVTHTLKVDDWACEHLFNDGYYDTTKAFIDRAKEIQPDIVFEDIYQALRNVWVMNSLQVYLGADIGLTNAIFAYSMLYPLTDNYLDNTEIPKKDKKSFNKRFYDKIKHNTDQTINDDEKLIFSMIDLIEIDYPRDQHPNVYKSLLAILDGQNKSLDQHNLPTVFDKDILSYTFYKGGSSVLADAYLINGDLSENEALFAYGYGVILQLADDIQDIVEDNKNGHNTLMSIQSNYSNLDGIYLKLEALVTYFFDHIVKTETKNQKALNSLLVRSVELLLFGAACMNKSNFSKTLIKQINTYGYFSKKAYTKYNKKFMKNLKVYR